MSDIYIYGKLRNKTTDNELAGTDQIKDTKLGKFQETINEDLTTGLNSKQNISDAISIRDTDKTVDDIVTNLTTNALRKTSQELTEAEKTQVQTNLGTQKQLVSGTNIKTINGKSILGEGDLKITEGSGGTSIPDAPKDGKNYVRNNGAWKDLGDSIKILSQSEYDSLQVKDPSTIYFIR